MYDMMMWNDLVRWVQEIDSNSIVHKSLTLRSTSNITTTDGRPYHLPRGLFASDTMIHQGDILIQLPLTASINGKMMPRTYEIDDNIKKNDENATTTKSTRTVSPWLRCLAALLKELQLHDDNNRQQHSSPYLASLPNDYETLWQWSTREIEEYLAGTRPPNYDDFTSSTSACQTNASCNTNPWIMMNDPTQTRQQYATMIRPYLIHCGIISSKDYDELDGDDNTEEIEYQQFQRACQIMSTRSFYNNSHASTINSIPIDDDNDIASNDRNTKYNGPFLLPIIDLINHADTCTGDTNTKLECIVQPNSDSSIHSYCFVMRALQNILPNTEILHSYGDELSNYQFLSSFGCIPINRMMTTTTQLEQQVQEQVSCESITSNSVTSAATTSDMITNSLYTKSVILTKQEIWNTCWDIIESGLPQQLATSMIESQSFDPDEIWNISIDKLRTADCVPNNIVVAVVQPASFPGLHSELKNDGDDEYDETNNSTSTNYLLSDEIVTTTCIPFLPKCAYAEITSRTLLDVSILQDYYLGQLVGTALLQTIQQRLVLYRPIPMSTVQRLLPSTTVMTVDVMDDKEILRNLLPYIETSNSDVSKNNVTESDLYIERCRLAYGLTIRLEEKEVLKALGKAILVLLNSLSLNIDNDSNNDDTSYENDKSTKKVKSNPE